MKLQELFRKSNFDKMYDYIVKFDPYSEGNRFAYQAAYKLLCNMEAEEGREYMVDSNYYMRMHEYSKDVTPVLCSGLEGCNWKKALGAEMKISSEVEKIPMDLIAAVCLWHITYYGFTPEDQEMMFTADQEEKKYQEIKDHEKEVEELFSILVGNKDNQTPYVPHGPAMIDPPNLGKYNHKLQNTEAKERINREIDLIDKLYKEWLKSLDDNE